MPEEQPLQHTEWIPFLHAPDPVYHRLMLPGSPLCHQMLLPGLSEEDVGVLRTSFDLDGSGEVTVGEFGIALETGYVARRAHTDSATENV